MIRVHIKRGYHAPDVTLGMMYIENIPTLPPIYTLEEPWKDNQRGISCVPMGQYTCAPHNGTRFKNVWRLENVPDRTAVLIHAGNTTDDIEGCILVGLAHGTLQSKPAVLQSQRALELLRNRLGGQTFTLFIS